MTPKKTLFIIALMLVMAVLLSACDPSQHFGLGTCSKWNSCSNGIAGVENIGQALLVGAMAVSLSWNRIRRKAIALVLILMLLAACGSPVRVAGGDPTPGWNQPISTR